MIALHILETQKYKNLELPKPLYNNPVVSDTPRDAKAIRVLE